MLLNSASTVPLSLLKKSMLTCCHRNNSNSGVLLVGITPAGNLFAYAVHQHRQFGLIFKGQNFHIGA